VVVPLLDKQLGTERWAVEQLGRRIITDGVDGFILEDPHDSGRSAELIDLLCSNEPCVRRSEKRPRRQRNSTLGIATPSNFT
jgi:hypothetical protein